MRWQDARCRPHADFRGYRPGPESLRLVPCSSAACPLSSLTCSTPRQKCVARPLGVSTRIPHLILQGFGQSPSRETPLVNDDA